MPVTSVTTDPEALTMTLVGDFAAPVERLWRAFTEPAQLERFWGPPGWPATF
ncbi:MAG TPA: ATPase, partial [Microbacterium sp.]|nr:ATPase [Microbacterium sp.]